MAISQFFIAKQMGPFGDDSSLKKRWQFCDLLLLNKQCHLTITYR
jgi:hypothetical protein